MITVNGISKSYGNNHVLTSLDCGFQEGEVSSIIAPNGTGKTTLMSVISGLLMPDAGSVTFSDGCRRENISVVFAGEKNLYMKNTVLENLLYFAIIQGMSVKEGMARIAEYKEYLPFIGEVEGKLAEKLSYGQKRLVAIFSAIITNARCIIIDEAGEGLDMSYVQLLKRMLKKAAQGRIVILASHDYDFVAKISDKILFLKEGKIIEEHAEMKVEDLKNRYAEVYNVVMED